VGTVYAAHTLALGSQIAAGMRFILSLRLFFTTVPAVPDDALALAQEEVEAGDECYLDENRERKLLEARSRSVG
jgi:hypothetical protein